VNCPKCGELIETISDETKPFGTKAGLAFFATFTAVFMLSGLIALFFPQLSGWSIIIGISVAVICAEAAGRYAQAH